MSENNQTVGTHELTMNSLKDIIQRCHHQQGKSLRQRKTKVSSVPHKDNPYHFKVHCARGHTVSLYDLEQADISFMPIGHAPEYDHPPSDFGGERLLKRQATRDWILRRWYASWGIQVYTGIPSGRDGAQWHDINFKYDGICVDPDAISTCIETLVNSVANPLLTLTKSGGLRFSSRVQNYLHSNTDEAKQYVHKHTPTAENLYHRDVYLEIFGAEGYNRWDGRYEILLGDLLDPPIITKEVLFAPIDALRAALHEPAPPLENDLESTFQAVTIPRLLPTPVDEKVIAIREGKLSPLALKRPSPMLCKSENGDSSRAVSTLHVIEHDLKTGWLFAVDDAGNYLTFPEILISKDLLDAWSIEQQKIALGNFAKALLNALESKSDFYETPTRRVRMVVQAFERQEETLIQQMNEHRSLWHQLKRFLAHYQRDVDAPIVWDKDMLQFWVPSEQDVKIAFPNAVKNTTLEPWGVGNRFFQIRTGIYSMHQILNYENSWGDLEFSEIGKRFFLGIRAEIERDSAVQHVVIGGERVAEHLSDTISTENASYLRHIKRAIHAEEVGNAFEPADVIWIVGAPYWPPHLIWKQAQILFGSDAEPLCYDVEMDPYRYKDERLQGLCEQNIVGILTQLVGRMGLSCLSNKTVVLLTSMPLPHITDRPETLLFDWEDFEIAGGLDKLPEVIATRERFETERDNLTVESGREEVAQVLGISRSHANRVLMKLRGGKIERISFHEQICSLLKDGEKKTAELIAAIEGHPGAVKNELKRLVDSGEIVKVGWGMYALPKA